jgi:hypothetical protein
VRSPIKNALLLAALALLPVAGARADTIKGGNVHLRLKGALSRQLEEQSVRLVGLKAGFAGHQAVSLRISRGEIEGKGGSGYLFLEGGFRLQAGKKSVTVRRLLLHTSEGFLSGVVDGTKLKLASLPPQQALIGIFDIEVIERSLKLTPKAAAAFNRELGLDSVFKAGGSLGTATARVDFESLTVRSGQLSLTIDNAFREKLEGVEAALSTSLVTAPIQNGQLSRDLAGGFLSGEAGFSITPKGGPVNSGIGFFALTIDLEAHALQGQASLYTREPPNLFSAPLASLPTFPVAEPFSRNPSSPLVPFESETGEARSAALAATLSPELAQALNELFGAPKGKPDYFRAGEPFGSVTFTALTR